MHAWKPKSNPAQPIQSFRTKNTLTIPSSSQLHIIIHQPDLLTRLERRQPNIRAPIAPKRISQRTVTARAHFALHRKVHFRQVLGLQFGQVGVCLRALGGVFGVQTFCEAAAAVFAGAAALGVGEACFGCDDSLVYERNGKFPFLQ